MKKILSLALVLVMALSTMVAFTSCDELLALLNEEDSLSAAYDKALADIDYNPDDYSDTLVVAMSPDFAPMEFYDTAKSGDDAIVGFDVLLATYVAKELGMKLKIDPMSFDASMAAVASGNADLAISGFSWTAERAETFLISDYYVAGENETEQILITKAGTVINANTDFSGMKIGAQGGSLQELLVKEQLVTKGASIELFANINDAAVALETGDIDALAVAYGNGEALASETIVLSDYYFEVEEKYKNNVILLNKEDAELLEKVNAALAKAMDADLYDGWYEACQIYAEVKTLDELGYDDQGNKITE